MVAQVPAPAEPSGVRAPGCDHGHFFATAANAAEWQRGTPGRAAVMPVAEGHAFGSRPVQALPGADTTAPTGRRPA